MSRDKQHTFECIATFNYQKVAGGKGTDFGRTYMADVDAFNFSKSCKVSSRYYLYLTQKLNTNKILVKLNRCDFTIRSV